MPYQDLRKWLRSRFPRYSGPRRWLREFHRFRKRLRKLYRDPYARLLYYLSPASIMRDRRYFGLWERKGFHVIQVHFYSPIPETRTLTDDLWEQPSETIGIDWNERAQVELLSTFKGSFKGEYDRFPVERTESYDRFSLSNSSFGQVDAEILYSMIRYYKPGKIMEIGSGHSTLLAAQAVRVNAERGGHECELIAIDPYPDDALKRGFPGLSRVVDQPVQSVPLSEFTKLGDNDILFIDSSHVLKIGSDVQYEFLQILPRIGRGTLVHIHDIFLPAEYPRQSVIEQHNFWTEQYLLQAFLAFNSHFQVLWSSNYMHLSHADNLKEAFRSYASDPSTGGGSFWMRRVG